MRRLPWVVLLGLGLLSLPAAQADDPDPPTFKSVSVGPGPFSPGDIVPLQVRWEDSSGIAQVGASAVGPGELRALGVQCEDPQGDRVAVVDCTLQLHARTPGGTYRIVDVSAQDVVGHHANAQVDAPFTVDSPYTDTEGPVLKAAGQNVTAIDMSNASASWNLVMLNEAFALTASDASNVTDGYLSFAGPNGNHGLWAQCQGWKAQASACQLYADPEVPDGDYVLSGIQLGDEIGYRSHYHYNPQWYGEDLAPVLPQPFVVHVASPRQDDEAPVLADLTFPGRLHRGQPFELWLNATDETVVESAQVFFRTTRGNAGYSVWHGAHCEGEPAADRSLRCIGRFPDNFPLGLAVVDWLWLEDEGRNSGWLRPVQVGGPGEHSFADGDRFDVGTVLVPRPIEGVLEAIDAVVNEVLPGEVATLVYETEDAVDDVMLVLEDAADGSRIEISCADAVATLLGQECTFTVPAQEEGILSLVSATATGAQGVETSTYASGEVPLLAVHQQIPASEGLPLARGGGVLNDVGSTWQTVFTQAKAEQQAAFGSGNGTVRAEPPAPVPTQEESREATSQPLAPEASLPPPTRFNFTRLAERLAEREPVREEPPPAPARETSAAPVEAEGSPMPAAPLLAGALALAALASRRRPLR